MRSVMSIKLRTYTYLAAITRAFPRQPALSAAMLVPTALLAAKTD